MLTKFRFSPKGIYLLQEAIVFLVISMLLLVIGFTHSIIQYRILIIAVSLWTLLGVFWLIVGNSARVPFKIPVMIWITCYLISSIGSIDPRRSFGQMLIMTTSLFIFYFVYDLVNKGWSENLFVKGLIFASSFITISGLVNALLWYQNWLTANPGVFFPTINYRPLTTNLMATFLYLSAILCCTYFFYTKSKINRFILVVNSIAALFMLYLTSSRGGWLAAAAGFGVLFFLLIWQNKINIKQIWGILKKRPIILGGLIIVGILISAILAYFLYQKALHPTHGGLLSSRKTLWEPAIETFIKNPIFGQGPFTYGSSFIRSNSTPPSMIYVHAHSIPMNTLAEMGIFGILALGFLVFSYIKKLISLLKSSLQAIPPIVIGTIAYATSFLVHNFFDSLALEPSLLWPATILLGATMGSLSKNQAMESKSNPTRSWWIVIPITIAWIGIWMVTPYHKGVELGNQNQWQAAREQFSIAVKRDPASTIAHQQLGLVNSVLASQGDSEALLNAINELNQTVKQEPSWALNYANLASLYAENDQLAEAQISAQKSVQLAPQVGLYQLNLGVIAEQNQDLPVASQAYQMVLQMEPEWADTNFWTFSPLWQEVLKDWQSQNPVASKQTIAELEAQLQANLQSTWAYNQLAQAYLEQGNPDRAEELLSDASLAYAGKPSKSIETTWLKAEVFAARGDYQQAIMIGEQAIQSFQSYGVYGPGSFGFLYYAPRMFRSPAIAMEIVPQMVDVPMPEKWMERQNRLQYWKTKS